MAALHSMIIKAGESVTLKLRLTDRDPSVAANLDGTAPPSAPAKRGNASTSTVSPTVETPPALGDFKAGFEAVYMSGYCVAASRGKPDIGLISGAEMIAQAAQAFSERKRSNGLAA